MGRSALTRRRSSSVAVDVTGDFVVGSMPKSAVHVGKMSDIAK